MVLPLVLACQLTDVGIAGIKAGEIIMAVLTPFILSGAIKKKSGAMELFCLFSLFLLLALIKNQFTIFYSPQSASFLRQPYLISVSRYIQILICVLAVLHVWQVANGGDRARRLAAWFLRFNAVFGIVFIIAAVLSYIGIDNDLTYGNDNRLRGFFIEGGPLGLFYAALFCFSYFIKKRITPTDAVFAIVVVLSYSKAGAILIAIMLAYASITTSQKIGSALKTVFILALAMAGAYFAYGDRLAAYVSDTVSIESAMKGRENDTSLVMGRIAGVHIGAQMIKENPLFGVGLGNYSLVRNDPVYRANLPYVDDWDLTGLGLFTLAVECGLVGLAAFLVVVISLIRRIEGAAGRLIAITAILCFMLGVQIYFIYPWVIFAIGSVLSYATARDAARQLSTQNISAFGFDRSDRQCVTISEPSPRRGK